MPLMQRVDKDAIARMLEDSRQDLLPAGHTVSAASATGTDTASKSATPAKTAQNAKSVEATQANVSADAGSPADSAIAGVISIKEFAQIDLRIARVLAVQPVEGADKLLQLTLDVGPLGQRTVFSGIRSQYAPDSLTGRLVVLVANLAPRKMRFGISEGMVIAAGSDRGIFLLAPDNGAQPGDQVS